MIRIQIEHFTLHSIVSFSGAYNLPFFFVEGQKRIMVLIMWLLVFLKQRVLRTLFVTYGINTICSIVGYTFESIFIKRLFENPGGDPKYKNIENAFLKKKLMKNDQGPFVIKIR